MIGSMSTAKPQPKTKTPGQLLVACLREHYKTDIALADALFIKISTLKRWKTGETTPPPSKMAHMDLLLKVKNLKA